MKFYILHIDGFLIIKCPIPKGKYTIKKQLYSGHLTLREASSFIFYLYLVRTQHSAY